MASEYLETDTDGLGRLAILIDQFYVTADPKLMTEIRLQEARFGLSPVDRSRLHWELAKGGNVRHERQAVPPTRDAAADDPRDVLRIVG